MAPWYVEKSLADVETTALDADWNSSIITSHFYTPSFS
jgi:hypothetical protein